MVCMHQAFTNVEQLFLDTKEFDEETIVKISLIEFSCKHHKVRKKTSLKIVKRKSETDVFARNAIAKQCQLNVYVTCTYIKHNTTVQQNTTAK